MSSYMMARRATSKNYRFLTTDASPSSKPTHTRTNSFDLNESDVWGGGGGSGGSTQSNSAEFRAPARKPMYAKKASASSVPVNVPDWSKILREEYKGRWNTADYGGNEDDKEEDEEEWVAPHEYLSRTRNASFSVQEGVGRTLKGRDLSRLRNAIWEKTGFQD